MAITVVDVGRSRGAPAASGSTVITWATDESWTLLENDIIVITIGNVIADNVSISTDGYTELTGGLSNGTHWLKVYWKRMGASPDATVTIAYSGATSYTETHHHLRGVDPTVAIDAAIQTSSGASGSVDPPSLTTVTAGALRIIGGSIDDDRVDTTVTEPAGYSNLMARQSANTGANAHTTYTATKLAGAPGAENPAAFGSGGDDTWMGFHVAFRPIVRSVTASAGSYAVTGTDATLKIARKTAAGAGSYTTTGTDATLKRALKLAAGAGSYSHSGTDAALSITAKVTAAAAGSYAHSGTNAGLLYARKIAAGAGSYAISGTDATLVLTTAGQLVTVAEPGSYGITGTDATLSIATVEPEPEPEPVPETNPLLGGGPGGGRRARRLRKKFWEEMGAGQAHRLLAEWDRPAELTGLALELKERFDRIVGDTAPAPAPELPKFDPAPFLERIEAQRAAAERLEASMRQTEAALEAERVRRQREIEEADMRLFSLLMVLDEDDG